MQAEVEDVLHIAGKQRGNAEVEQHGLGLAAQRRAFAGGIVAGDGQHAAVLANAGVIGVFQRVAGAVDAGRLAVPHAGDAIELLLADRVQHLRAPHRRRGEVFVQAVDEMDVVLQQQFLLLDQRRVEHADRRTAIAGNEHAGVQAAPRVHAHLIQRQAHQGVDAAEMNVALVLGEYAGHVLLG